MSLTISITESDLMTALRAFLLALLPAGWQVVKAQDNRVAMPTGSFVEMTALSVPMLSTPKSTFDAGSQNPGIENSLTSSQWRCQLDFYGPGSGDMATAVSRIVRTDYACTQFAASGIDMQPLYADEPRNTNMLNAENQFQDRWTFDFVAQFNPVVALPQDFAIGLTVIPAEVDAVFPP